MKQIHAYQVTRALSSAGDEMWNTALPIYLAFSGVAASKMGLIFSVGAFGSLIGFISIPVLCRRMKSAHVASVMDVLQLILFSVVGAVILRGGDTHNYWAPIQFLASLFGAIWYGASETLMTRVSDSTTSQSAHKWNYFAGNLGPALGPALAGIVYGLFGLIAIAVVNAVSFASQAVALRWLSDEEEFEENEGSFLTELTNGFKMVWTDLRLRFLTLVPVTIKVFLLGALPFIAFALGKNEASAWLIGAALTTFSVGSLLGAFSWRTYSADQLLKAYRFDTGLLILVTAAINILLFASPHAIPMAVLTLLAGWFVARYSIALRALRQTVVSKRQMPIVVASQGFLARLATPLAGVLYGSMLSKPVFAVQMGSILLFVCVAAYGVTRTYRAFSVES